MNRKIRVLVVDDSLLFREVIARGIETDPAIEVVAKAADPFEARDKILEFEPDVMTCDVEMPKMNGIEFIRRLLPQYSIPVIVISTVSEAVFDALNAGAVDFIQKPEVQSPKSVESFLLDITSKIKVAAKAKIVANTSVAANILPKLSTSTNKIIAIGASTGGTEAIFSILSKLPAEMPGILVVQHIPSVFSKMFAERLNNQTKLKVKEAETGDWLEQGRVLIAPGDKHMRIKRVGEKIKVETFQGEKVNGHCPSVDIMFESVAKETGSNAVGIILTGMGYDGARGLLTMRRKGARTIGQDEKSSIVFGMPRVAYEIGAVEKQTSLDKIPLTLIEMLK